MSRIDDAVTRILTVKCELGMLDDKRYARDRSGQIAADAEMIGAFGSEEHRAVAREAVSKSLVLLKNEGNLLPLSKELPLVTLAGKGADDIGRQCGGWTLSWQGQTGDIMQGTTVREAFEAVLSAERVRLSVEGDVAEGSAVAVAVIGERPYAEFNGDRDDLALHEDDIAAVKNLKAAGIPVVVVLLSGRPLILGEVGELADAIVAAWLPGTEGAGIADVLFGDLPFSGKLPHSWPRSMDQIPINVGDADYDPLYAYGYGLTTKPAGTIAPNPTEGAGAEIVPKRGAPTAGEHPAGLPRDPEAPQPPARPLPPINQ
jgi:beta-glucosidase